MLTHFPCIGCSHLHVCFVSKHISSRSNSQRQWGDIGQGHAHLQWGAPWPCQDRQDWGVKAMSNTVRCLMINSTHWHVYPGASFCWSISAKHWSVVRTFKACSSPSDRSNLARVGARHKSTVSEISWLRTKSHLGSDGHDPLLTFQHKNHTNIAAMYLMFLSCLILAISVHHGGSIIFCASKHIKGITSDKSGLLYPINRMSL